MPRMSIMKSTALLATFTLLALATGCKKEFDSPPRTVLPVGSVLTIAELKAMFTNAPVHFSAPMSVYCVVNSDENDGNFYKSIYAQDATGGICLRLLNSGGLYIGDSIRIALQGTVLAPYNGLMQLDSIDVDVNVIKQATLVPITPLDVDVAELTPAALDTLQSRLIRLSDVEFTVADAAGGTWADGANQETGERYLENCDGDQVMMRTSGYANYASQPLPTGRGSLLAIPTIFGSTVQLAARTLAEVQLNGPRCPGQELPFFFKNFQDQSLTSGGWIQKIVSGETNYVVQDLGSAGNFYAVCNNFSNGVAAETWLISPAVNTVGTSNPKLSFRNASRFAGPVLEVLVSTDYDGTSDPSTATWTPLSPTLDLNTSAYVWTESGLLDISAFSSANFRVAFKYTAPAPSGSAWEVDDIKIIEQ